MGRHISMLRLLLQVLDWDMLEKAHQVMVTLTGMGMDMGSVG